MWDFLKENAGLLQGVGAIVSGAGNAYAARQQAKTAQKNYDLNLDLLKEERARRKKAQQNLDQAWNSSAFYSQNINKDEE